MINIARFVEPATQSIDSEYDAAGGPFGIDS
jgi:hypothetical protein